ncbi:MAG: UPF0164 family protein, partial [Candidatus Delongbacteria bacterium]|nr:UPF0164 family protein [Candidatus Delongbacteria bacterium]
MKFKKLITILCALSVSLVSASTDLMSGARPQSMGGAYTAISGDVNSITSNPAGLAGLKSGEASFNHMMFSEIDQLAMDQLFLAYPLGKGSIGLSWVRKGATLEQGINSDETTMSENFLNIAFGLNILEKLSAGGSLKRTMINSEIGDGSGFGFDAGVIYRVLEKHNWTLGVTGRNLLADMKNETLKAEYFFGTAYKTSFSENMHQLTFAFDIGTKEDINESEGISYKYFTGLEYLFSYTDFSFGLRGGINSNASTVGFGLS